MRQYAGAERCWSPLPTGSGKEDQHRGPRSCTSDCGSAGGLRWGAPTGTVGFVSAPRRGLRAALSPNAPRAAPCAQGLPHSGSLVERVQPRAGETTRSRRAPPAGAARCRTALGRTALPSGPNGGTPGGPGWHTRAGASSARPEDAVEDAPAPVVRAQAPVASSECPRRRDALYPPVGYRAGRRRGASAGWLPGRSARASTP